ncbi:MAG: helix-turn-helix transcriptional regulator [Acidobacteriota bacterium]
MLRTLLQRRDITLKALAEKTGKQQSTISNALAQPNLRFASIAEYCAGMGATPADFAAVLLEAAGGEQLVTMEAAKDSARKAVAEDLAGELRNVIAPLKEMADAQADVAGGVLRVLDRHAGGAD